MPTTFDSVLLPGFAVEHVTDEPARLTIVAHPSSRDSICPSCGVVATRVHSYYERTPRDVPISDRVGVLRLRVRRFRCLNPQCPRRSFAERLSLLPRYAHQTTRLRLALHALGAALGGAAGARLSAHLHMPTSLDTLLRLLHKTPIDIPTLRVVGVDDVALRRGRRYGPVLVDVEHRRPVDVLPDRDAQPLELWLQAHLGIQGVPRDRSREDARGATAGAPTAMQVADRWHLLLNLREMLERLLERLHEKLRTYSPPPAPAPGARVVDEHRRRLRGPSDEAARMARRERHRSRYAAVLALYQQGKSMRQIATDLHLSRWVVQHFLQAEGYPERLPHRERLRVLTPVEPYLLERWATGCRNSAL